MKAIVLGATGLVGRAVVEKLLSSEAITSIRAITRRPVDFGSAKVINQVLDFEKMAVFSEAFQGNIFFSCLGTTLKQAGSQEAQRRVDYDYQLKAAELALAGGVNHYLLVSSSMANAESKNFYLRLKGQLEEKILQLPFERISIFRPSVLIGERAHTRPSEKLTGKIFSILQYIPILKKYRPIEGQQVAQKMVTVSLTPGPKRGLYEWDDLFR